MYETNSSPELKTQGFSSPKIYKEYRKNNKEKIDKYQKEYRENHKKESKEYNKNHKEKRNEYQNNRKKTDINYKLAYNLRNRLNKALKGNYKSGSAVKDMGCSIIELKIHLERQFKKGISWDNYGKWHIDHVKPLASFNLSDRNEFLEACHYTNLQPLWAKENMSKGDKLINNIVRNK